MRKLYENWGTADKGYHIFPGFFHDTLGEKDRHLPLAKARSFIESHFAVPFAQPDLTHSDERGFTYEEMQRLNKYNYTLLWC